MAPKHPVPSKAALNALRGVILTTSCSVVLLAEERRRRLQIARAAIENARKLHLIQSNRGPTTLAESHGAWEGRFVEAEHDVLSSFPRPRTSTRRRGRSHLIGSQGEPNFQDNNGQRTPSHSRAEKESGSAGSNPAAAFLGQDPDIAISRDLKLPRPNPISQHTLDWKAPRSSVQPTTTRPPQAVNKSGSYLSSSGDNYKSTPDISSIATTDSIASARQYLEKLQNSAHAPRPYYHDAMSTLDKLLTDLEACCVGTIAFSDRTDLACEIFERLAIFGRPIPSTVKPLRSQGIRLLQIVSTASPERLISVLKTLLPLSKDPLTLLVPFLACAQNQGCRDAIRDTLIFFSQNPKLCSWARGMLLCRLFGRYDKGQPTFSGTRHLYRAFQDAGLFQDLDIPKRTEYQIRRLMITLALKHGDDAFAEAEIRKLENVDANACKSDIRLQKELIARKAGHGKWTEVFSDIETLGRLSDIECIEFQTLLTKLTDIFAQDHSALDLEALLRQLSANYRLKLKYRWVYAVLDEHASRRQSESVFSWLQFCDSTGLEMDSKFHQRFFSKCRKYWSFSDKTVRDLQQRLQDDKAQGKRNFETATSTELPAAKGKLSQQMESLASQCLWEQVGKMYDAEQSEGMDDAAGCLRFAVLAHIKGDNGDLGRARSLVHSAHAKGQDVSAALPPLLLAQLERGDDPSTLVAEALRMGVRVHDSVFNKAAQALSAEGNYRAAAHMCEVAAKENGNGNLLYSEYNFANLVFAHTGSAGYASLRSLLSRFTSETRWWHGSRTCKESIKLAMKTTAMRAVAHTRDNVPHREALNDLDHALIHVKRCRATKEERRAVSEAYVRLAKTTPIKAPLKATRSVKSKISEATREQRALDSVDHPVLAASISSC